MYIKIHNRGFTLIEIAIVLVIIGIILGSISIGKDLQRDAENKKIYQKFISQWKTAYDQYYSKVGVVIGDSQVAPTYMVNGFEANIGDGNNEGGGAVNNSNGTMAGIPQNFTDTGKKICHGQGYERDTVGENDAELAEQNLHDLLDRVGVRMPPGRSEGMEDRYLYLDTNGNPVELQICFQWNPAGTTSGSGNVMVLRGLTPDLARIVDMLVDGKPDAREGRFREQNTDDNTTGTSGIAGHEWRANNTLKYDSNENLTDVDAGKDITGENQDENQVILLTAHWVMDQ